MKSNRKFRDEEKAVSAVIGVILMVAITVAIAATVYVYVSGMLGGGAEKAPDMAFTKSSTGNLGLTVTRADAGMIWSEFEVNGNSTGPAGTADVSAGDFIGITAPAVGSSVTVTIRHIATNTLMGTWTWYG